MKIYAAIAVLALAPAAPAAASAASPAAYRAQANRLCRSYTPKLHALEQQMRKAQQTKDWQAYGRALGRALALALQQDAVIEQAPVPPALRSQMAPIIRMLKAADAHIRRALQLSVRGDAKGFIAELRKIDKLAAPLNARFDAAGLRDCGSNQS
jgi:hypothetical protein